MRDLFDSAIFEFIGKVYLDFGRDANSRWVVMAGNRLEWATVSDASAVSSYADDIVDKSLIWI